MFLWLFPLWKRNMKWITLNQATSQSRNPLHLQVVSWWLHEPYAGSLGPVGSGYSTLVPWKGAKDSKPYPLEYRKHVYRASYQECPSCWLSPALHSSASPSTWHDWELRIQGNLQGAATKGTRKLREHEGPWKIKIQKTRKQENWGNGWIKGRGT